MRQLPSTRKSTVYNHSMDSRRKTTISRYKDYKGLQAYMQRHQYTWNEAIGNYQLLEEYQKQMKTERVLSKFEDGASSKQ